MKSLQQSTLAKSTLSLNKSKELAEVDSPTPLSIKDIIPQGDKTSVIDGLTNKYNIGNFYEGDYKKRE